ncbi:MAG: hypothetical protein JSV91_07200 [Phycisphaerales bacterium]|nr:MAG: hypothetical protein JSV91_07200 [Phycisphaerales bacterium]
MKTLDHTMFVRRCVACGYDGALLQGGRAARCARCGCDLRERPARSYAEMEGFIGQPVILDSPREHPVPQEKLIHRWLAFLFFALLMLIGIAYLSSAALPT